MKRRQERVARIWTRIEKVLQVHAPEVFETLTPGASTEELKNIECALSLKLPSDLRRSLEIHNGQHDPSQCFSFCGAMHLMSTTDIIRDWKMLTEIGVECEQQEGIHHPDHISLNRDWWRRSCIPFGHSNGYYTCVDMKGAKGLKVGRIVEHTHDDAMEETNMPSFADWCERVALALEHGDFERNKHGFFRVKPKFAYKWNS